MRHIVAGALAVVCVLVLGGVQARSAEMDRVASIKTQLKTAIFHSSELAQKGSSIAGVQLHLQHTINCLEGPKGAHFKAAAGYPCQGQGNGIIPDLQAAAAQGVPGAKRALDDATIAWNLAVQGEGMTTVNEAQPWATVVARYLQMASDALGG